MRKSPDLRLQRQHQHTSPGSGFRMRTHPDPRLRQVGPHRDLLSGAHVGVAVPLERGLQLLQLLAGEVRPLPPLPLLLGRVVRGVLALVLDLFFLCGEEINRISVGRDEGGGSGGLSGLHGTENKKGNKQNKS